MNAEQQQTETKYLAIGLISASVIIFAIGVLVMIALNWIVQVWG
jgi:hypothetical protein